MNSGLHRTKSFINGEWVDAESGRTFDVRNPFSGELLAKVADCGREETNRAIAAAHEAFEPWKAMTAGERSGILKKWHDLQLENVEELARILTLEQGKPLRESKGEIKYGASFVEWFAEEARRVYGETIPGHQRDKRIVTIKQPVGVVGAITPWNFPNAMITRKVAPALAAGCPVVIKPAQLTPLSALALADLATKAGIPPGVFNIVTSDQAPEVGKELCENPLVKKVSFTGSTRVGKILLKQCADGVKRVSMELGGNAPFIIFEDADLDEAVKGAIASKFRNSGQTCVCTNRIFVHSSVAQRFIEKLVEQVRKLHLGNGLDEEVDVGPLINQKAVHFIDDLVSDAIGHGGELTCGGKRSAKHDQIYEPTVLTNLNDKMKIFREEIFGPVAPIFVFNKEEEVVAMANRTSYGLASYFYGRDYARIWRVAEALEYGMVGINTGMISTAVAPFGGIKESGFGREGSKYGMDDYLNIKYLCWGGI